MARKTKTQKKQVASKTPQTDFSNRREIFNSPDSYKSLIYGILTVIVLFVVGFSMVRLFTGGPKGSVDDGAVSTEQIQEALNNTSQKDYTVKEGETLWSIAEDAYGSGFEWYRIAEANKITDVTNLEKGTALVIPEDTQKASEQPTTSVNDEPVQVIEKSTPTPGAEMNAPNEASDKISGATYVIKDGDDLWDIAIRAYGDGYKWTEIATANSIENPDIIHPENTLKLPR